jgi:hypothetical protein
VASYARAPISRRGAIALVLLALAGTIGVPRAHADALDKLPFKIAASTAPQALAEFIHQTGYQVLFDFDAVRNFTTREVTGELDPQEALSRMLVGSGLTFEFINARTISVRPGPPIAVPAAQRPQ